MHAASLRVDQFRVGAEVEVLKKVKQVASVKEAYIVYGVYDIIAKLEAESFEDIRDIVAKIRGLDKVASTLTTIVAE